MGCADMRNPLFATETAPLAELIQIGYSVTRWHAMHNSRPQTLASHLWGVALILSRTYDGPPALFPVLLRCALEHDLAEGRIGDMPRPARTIEHQVLEVKIADNMGILHEENLPDELQPWLKWADFLEAGLHAQRELRVGNRNFEEVALKISDRILAEEANIPPPLMKFAREAGLILNWKE